MFQTFHWNRRAAEFFAQRERPHVVAMQNGNGAAIIPACIAGGEIKFLGEMLFDYPAPLWASDGGALAEAWNQLLTLNLPFKVFGIRDQDRNWPATPAPWTGAPFVSRELTSQEFAAVHLNSARRVRSLQRLGVSLRAEGATGPLLRRLYELKARTGAGGEENLFSDPLRRQFLVAVARSGDPPAELFRFVLGEEWIAALLTFRDGGIRRFYTIWRSHTWRRHSPGAALLYEVTRLSLEEGLECDYMTGDQPFKRRLATGIKPLYHLAMSAAAACSPDDLRATA